MRIVAWNVGHRTRAKPVPDSVVRALMSLSPDVIVLTEYVAGPDHDRFSAFLAEAGFLYSKVSDGVKGQNQVFIAALHQMDIGDIEAPDITPATRPNFLHVVLPEPGWQVIGCRVPMFEKAGGRDRYWEWFRETLGPRSNQPIVLAGDLNVDPANANSPGARHLSALARRGWSIASPTEGASFFSNRGRTSRLDHGLLGAPVRLIGAEYLTEAGSCPLAGADSCTYSDHAVLKLDVMLRDR